MLSIEELEEFETFITSGRIETDFEIANEQERFEMLDLLEKLMDVAELADEAATKLIFKGSYLEMMVTGMKSDK